MKIRKTTVVNCRYQKYDIYAGRPSDYGNPFIMGKDGDRDEVCDKHRNWLQQWILEKKEVIVNGYSNKWVVEHLSDLKGKRVACFCAPQRCHVDYLAKLADEQS